MLFSCKEHCLHPDQCVLFTWDEPSATKEFVWFVKGSKNFIRTELSKVGNLEYQVFFFSLCGRIFLHVLPETDLNHSN